MAEHLHKAGRQREDAILTDYDATRGCFRWEDARRLLGGLPGGRGLNIGYEAVDRHAGGDRRDNVALRCVDKQGATVDVTYADLLRQTNRFANLLASLGVKPGDSVFSLLGRSADLYVAALGSLRYTAVFSPLFAAFGPEPIAQRIRAGRGLVLITTADLYRAKVAPVRDSLPELRHVLCAGPGPLPPGTLSLDAELARQEEEFTVPDTSPERPALLHFTSGTTGLPKGAVHVHEAVVAHHATARFALDLRPDDIFWCTADPGWVTGMSYGVIAPLTIGATVLVDAGEFDARRWYANLQRFGITVWYTAPTALRMLMRYGPELAAGYDLSRLRHIASVGEPLNPEVVLWGDRVLGLPVHDNWWQTETGAIMISNYPSMDIRPGSMGRPMPGVDVALVQRHEDGSIEFVDRADEEGELALRAGWPSMFRGYLNDERRYAKCFRDGWYLSGDLARRDSDGYFWFVGRADDVIKSAGHLIGPFEVESALMEHPAVAEAGVIGKPDPVVGEIVKAFVTLRAGFDPTDALRLELLGFGRKHLGGVAPKEIVFDQNLPHTRSGKVMRRLLKARELGLPEGDTSTLEVAT
ncbi:MAG: acetate--CoA ligase [Betaproteobacteria bacterium]